MDIVESPNVDPTATVLIDGRYYRPEEVDQLMEQRKSRAAYEQRMRDGWLQSPKGQMCTALYDKFQEYKGFLEKNRRGNRRPDGAPAEYEEHQLFAQVLEMMQTHNRERALRDQQNLERAQRAVR